MKDTKILIISPYFAPENGTATKRFTKIGKYLSKRGHHITVLSSKMSINHNVDPLLQRDLKWFEKVVCVNQHYLYYLSIQLMNKIKSYGESAKKKKNHKARGISSFFMNNKMSRIWWTCIDYLSARKMIRVIKKEFKETKFDVVITTYSPISAHMIGMYMKKQHLCKKWIADYRDTLGTLTPYKQLPKLLLKINSQVLKLSDVITVVSRGQKYQLIKESMLKKNELRKKIYVIYNGFDEEERVIHLPTEEKFTIAYCGSLYKKEGVFHNYPVTLFKAISELIQDEHIKKENINFIYAGNDFLIMKSLAEQFNLESILLNLGYVSRKKSLETQAKSDIILISVWNNSEMRGIISGKFYEAILVRRPILAIVSGKEGKSELKNIINNCHLGFCLEEAADDYAKLKMWLKEKYEEKKQQGIVREISPNNVKRFQYDYIAKEVEKLIEF